MTIRAADGRASVIRWQGVRAVEPLCSPGIRRRFCSGGRFRTFPSWFLWGDHAAAVVRVAAVIVLIPSPFESRPWPVAAWRRLLGVFRSKLASWLGCFLFFAAAALGLPCKSWAGPEQAAAAGIAAGCPAIRCLEEVLLCLSCCRRVLSLCRPVGLSLVSCSSLCRMPVWFARICRRPGCPGWLVVPGSVLPPMPLVVAAGSGSLAWPVRRHLESFAPGRRLCGRRSFFAQSGSSLGGRFFLRRFSNPAPVLWPVGCVP